MAAVRFFGVCVRALLLNEKDESLDKTVWVDKYIYNK